MDACQVLAPLRRVSAAYEREVEAVFALIAYEAPAESPLQHLVGDRAREAVADVVNAAILLDAQRSARAAAIAAETGVGLCAARLSRAGLRPCALKFLNGRYARCQLKSDLFLIPRQVGPISTLGERIHPHHGR